MVAFISSTYMLFHYTIDYRKKHECKQNMYRQLLLPWPSFKYMSKVQLPKHGVTEYYPLKYFCTTTSGHLVETHRTCGHP